MNIPKITDALGAMSDDIYAEALKDAEAKVCAANSADNRETEQPKIYRQSGGKKPVIIAAASIAAAAAVAAAMPFGISRLGGISDSIAVTSGALAGKYSEYINIPRMFTVNGIYENSENLPNTLLLVNIDGRCYLGTDVFTQHYDEGGAKRAAALGDISYKELYSLPVFGQGYISYGIAANDFTGQPNGIDRELHDFCRVDDDTIVMRNDYLTLHPYTKFKDVPAEELIEYTVFRYSETDTVLAEAAADFYGMMNGDDPFDISSVYLNVIGDPSGVDRELIVEICDETKRRDFLGYLAEKGYDNYPIRLADHASEERVPSKEEMDEIIRMGSDYATNLLSGQSYDNIIAEWGEPDEKIVDSRTYFGCWWNIGNVRCAMWFDSEGKLYCAKILHDGDDEITESGSIAYMQHYANTLPIAEEVGVSIIDYDDREDFIGYMMYKNASSGTVTSITCKFRDYSVMLYGKNDFLSGAPFGKEGATKLTLGGKTFFRYDDRWTGLIDLYYEANGQFYRAECSDVSKLEEAASVMAELAEANARSISGNRAFTDELRVTDGLDGSLGFTIKYNSSSVSIESDPDNKSVSYEILAENEALALYRDFFGNAPFTDDPMSYTFAYLSTARLFAYNTNTSANVICPASGKVLCVQDNGKYNGGLGNAVLIECPDGRIYAIFYLSEINVRPGDSVNAGDILGASGNTGEAISDSIGIKVYRTAE